MAAKPETNVGELRRSGIVKLKGEDMYSMWVKTACSNLNSKQLRKLADITEKYARSYLLFTTRQIPIIPFVNLKDLEDVKEELNEVYLELDRCGTARQALWGGSYRGMQYHEFRYGEIFRSRQGH